MSVQSEHRPDTVEESVTAPPPATPRPAAARTGVAASGPGKPKQAKGHNGLIALGVFVAIVLAFAAMVLLTMLAGGDGYVR